MANKDRFVVKDRNGYIAAEVYYNPVEKYRRFSLRYPEYANSPIHTGESKSYVYFRTVTQVCACLYAINPEEAKKFTRWFNHGRCVQ